MTPSCRPNRFLVAAVLVLASVARLASADAPKHTLRIATAAPDDTGWAKIFHKFAREVAKQTTGEVAVKIYFGGVAGDETEVHALLERGKLDGAISGGPLCAKVMPAMRALSIIGLFQSEEEAGYVTTALRPRLDHEAHEAGYALLATGSIGPLMMFSRQPIASMADLRKTRLWNWDLNDVLITQADALKLSLVATSLVDAQKAFDDKRTEGFLTTPVVALAFQWYVGTKYITDLRMGYNMGCFVMRERAIDALPVEYQRIVRKSASKVGIRIEADNRRMDEKLLGGIYQHLGVQLVPVNKKFHAEFFQQSRAVRDRLGEALAPRELMRKIMQLLADYRAEHD